MMLSRRRMYSQRASSRTSILLKAGNGCEVECVEADSRTRRKAFAPASSSCSNVAPSSKRADQYKRNGFDPAARVLRESVPGRPILGHKQKWVAERRICSVDEAAGSMPRDTAGLELWVRNQSDFAGFRWCYGNHGEEVSTGHRSKSG